MPGDMVWLPPPARGTPVCLGMDGSDSDDWTALRAETRDGYQFTPRFGPDRAPTIWIPAQHGGRVPRLEVDAALAEVMGAYPVSRMYMDPPMWRTEGETWISAYGEETVFFWETSRVTPMHSALVRFSTDLSTGRIRQDGCPLTSLSMQNARKSPRPGERYILKKPSETQKIDPSMASVLAHEAACDARASGWGQETRSTVICFTR